VNCKDGSTLWSQHYDRPYKDLFALQDDITKSVADALKTKLLDSDSGAVAQSDRPPGGSLAAYKAYLHGKFYLQQGTAAGSQQAIAQFDEATRLDPDYAAAYAQSANAWASLAGTFLTGADNVRDANAKAHADVATALRLNPNLATAHEARAGLMTSVDFDWTGALAEAQRAVQLDPGSVSAKFTLAGTESRLGHVETAVELSQQTLANAPLNGGGYFGLGRKLIGLGRLAEAETALRESIKLAPGANRPYTYLAMIEILRGNAAAALAQAKKEPAGHWHEVGVALALQVGPDRAAADAALKKMVADYAVGDSYQIAEIYALRRDPDNMFLWLERARVNRDAGIELMLFDPFILRYKNDPRFAAFARKVGLPATTDAKALP
jgi:tetratricopeptide (TPR) repeat protein